MVSNKTVPEGLNLKLRSNFNPGFTIHGYLHYAILKATYGLMEKRDHKARDSQFEIFKIQNLKFKIFKMRFLDLAYV